MVERGLPKPETRVRFPSPAPFSFNNLHSCAGKVQENRGFFKLFFAQMLRVFSSERKVTCAKNRLENFARQIFKNLPSSPLRTAFYVSLAIDCHARTGRHFLSGFVL